LAERVKRIFKKRGESPPKEFEEIIMESDLKSVIAALDSKNVPRAARIAEESPYETTTIEFFLYVSDILEMFEEECDDDYAFARMVRKFLPHCRKLDADHPLTVELEMKARELLGANIHHGE
jgi:hypothetical protein